MSKGSYLPENYHFGEGYDAYATALKQLARFDESIEAGQPVLALGLSALAHAVISLHDPFSDRDGTIGETIGCIANDLNTLVYGKDD